MKYFVLILNMMGCFFDAKELTVTADFSNNTVCANGDQYHADPDDCHYFIQCSNGIPYRQKCAIPLYWNQELLTCQWSSDHCSEQISSTETATISTKAITTTATVYNTEGVWTETSTGLEKTTDTTTTLVACDNTEEADGTPQSTEIISPTTIKCKEGMITSTANCQYYRQCLQGDTALKKCPEGTYWNQIVFACSIDESICLESTTNKEVSTEESFETTNEETANSSQAIGKPAFQSTLPAEASTSIEVAEGSATTAYSEPTSTTDEITSASVENITVSNETTEIDSSPEQTIASVFSENPTTVSIQGITTSSGTSSAFTEDITSNGITNIGLSTEDTTSTSHSREITSANTKDVTESNLSTEIDISTEDTTLTSISVELTSTSMEDVTAFNATTEINLSTVFVSYQTPDNVTTYGTTEITTNPEDTNSNGSMETTISNETIESWPRTNTETVVATSTPNPNETTTSIGNSEHNETSDSTEANTSPIVIPVTATSEEITTNITSTSHIPSENTTTIENSTTDLTGNDTTVGAEPTICLGNGIEYYADYNNCTQFIECVNGQAKLLSCPELYYWHDKEKSCTQGKCPEKINAKEVTTDSTSITSVHNICFTNITEYHADPDDCNKFIECIYGQAHELSCPQFYYWDKKHGICTFGDCPKTESVTMTIELNLCFGRQLEFYANPDDCSKFLECVDGEGYELQCPNFYYWDGEDRSCVLGDCTQNAIAPK